MNHQTLADPPNPLGRAREDKVLKAPVVAHATRGMVVDANGKRVAVESSAGGSCQRAVTSLEAVTWAMTCWTVGMFGSAMVRVGASGLRAKSLRERRRGGIVET